MSSKRTVVKKRLDLLEDSGTLATVLYQDGLVKVADVNFFNFLKSTQPITSFPANDLGHTTGLNVVPNSMKVPLDKISEGLTAFAYYDDGLYYPATVNKLSNTVKRRKKDDERSTTNDPNKENNRRGSSEKKPKKKQGSASKNHVKTNTDTEESEIKKRKKQDEQAKKEAQVNRKLVELNR
ncbi:uncharacterized protein [Clytia hemisphaerica]|uniref:uncharacterized protein n=1 Tax=Clytia hemisphaerica TaxID=252671 RepID=UPI0034D6B170